MTAACFDNLQKELKHLKTVARPEVISEIAEARSKGDLSENAEYHAAKERQSQLERRIFQLEQRIARAEVVDISSLSGDRICFGATVSLKDEDTEQTVCYQIVGADEADIKRGLLSCDALLARELIGKRVGDTFEFSAPGGDKCYTIEKITFGISPGNSQ